MSEYIEAVNLTKKFPITKSYRDIIINPFRKKVVTALSHVNMSIKKGELFALLGSNGAGKTTLIKVFCTLVLPTSGKAFVNGLDVTTAGKDIRKKIGYVLSDERSFYWRLTGNQNLRFFAILNNIPKCEIKRRTQSVLECVGLTQDADRRFKDYSTGMRKKLAIARGLVVNPEILFMDEPTSGLDPLIAENIRKLIKNKLVEEEKKTVILTTHNLKEAEELCDRLAVIDKGEIKAVGTVEELKRRVSSYKRYVVGLKVLHHDILKKIERMNNVKQVVAASNGSPSTVPQIEIEVSNDNGTGPHLIREIMSAGGNVCSFYEKQLSLEELYPKILDFEKKEQESRYDHMH